MGKTAVLSSCGMDFERSIMFRPTPPPSQLWLKPSVILPPPLQAYVCWGPFLCGKSRRAAVQLNTAAAEAEAEAEATVLARAASKKFTDTFSPFPSLQTKGRIRMRVEGERCTKIQKKVSSSSSSSNAEFCQASNFATILPSPLYFSPNSNIFTPPSLPFAFCKKKKEGEGEGEQQMLRFRNVHLDICSERRRIFSESKGFFSSFVFSLGVFVSNRASIYPRCIIATPFTTDGYSFKLGLGGIRQDK